MPVLLPTPENGVSPVADKVDPTDPRVKKLVYNMYRGMLTDYNGEASALISGRDPKTTRVIQDQGVRPYIDAILRGTGCSEPDAAENVSNGASAPPPPPPPPLSLGAIPAVRLNTELREVKGPPSALAGAMMKDKKPFTYTPGGIDLSEIRSPRMAKRLQANAMSEGVTNTPKPAANGSVPPSTPNKLPPQALAAMQPQMAIPVFPQGGPVLPSKMRARRMEPEEKPFKVPLGRVIDNDEIPKMKPQIQEQNQYQGPPPPPPPHFNISQSRVHPISPPPHYNVPPVSNAQTSPQPNQSIPQPRPPPPPPNTQQIIVQQKSVSPVREIQPLQKPQPRTHHEQQRPKSPRIPEESKPSSSTIQLGSLYVAPVLPQGQPQTPRHTKAQVASQALGSIYIPPITPQQELQAMPHQDPPAQQPSSSGGSKPQLNKAPVPWMNSYNKMAAQKAESPPYVHQNEHPWPSQVRTVPIAVARDNNVSDPTYSATTPTSPPPTADSKAKAAQHLGRVIPIQIQRQQSLKEEQIQEKMQQMQLPAPSSGGWPRTIPIQVEGKSNTSNKGQGVSSPNATSQMYNNPQGNSSRNLQRQTSENLEQGQRVPPQSKSLRVVGKAAENVELRRMGFPEGEQEVAMQGVWPSSPPPWHQMPNFGINFLQDFPHTFPIHQNQFIDRQDLPSQSPHQGQQRLGQRGPIPSKAFKTLESILPPDSEQYSSSQSKQTMHSGDPVMHTIPIHLESSSGPQSPPFSPSSPLPPSEQRAPSPKKYTGSNIPSRSFKMLQQITAPHDDAASCSSSTSSQSSGESESESITPRATPLSFNPSPSSCPSPFPTSCNPSAWYYWWYYVTHFWSGYDMSGYEFPEGWDPQNPYFPPELSGYYGNDNVSDDYELDATQDFDGSAERECDNGNAYQEDSEGLDDTTQEALEDECIVEEPDTSSSSSTLKLDNPLVSPALFIEEYNSSSGSEASTPTPITPTFPLAKHFLSTIDEMTDEASSGKSEKDEIAEDQSDGSSCSEEDVSVIENKSASISISASGQSSSKREDETSSSSSSSSDEEEDDAAEATAVTVRLPLKLSFGKTKSYKDITTVLIGDSEEVKDAEEEGIPADDEEQIVSFTISLSRQVSEDEEGKDFWGEIGHADGKKDDSDERQDYWDDEKGEEEKCQGENWEDWEENDRVLGANYTEEQSCGDGHDYWETVEHVSPECNELCEEYENELAEGNVIEENQNQRMEQVNEAHESTNYWEAESEEEEVPEQNQNYLRPDEENASNENYDYWGTQIGEGCQNDRKENEGQIIKQESFKKLDYFWAQDEDHEQPGEGGELAHDTIKELITSADDYWGVAAEEEHIQEEKEVVDYWGTILEDCSQPSHLTDTPSEAMLEEKSESPEPLKTFSSKPAFTWDIVENFWEKPITTKPVPEVRRFSGNFEISEDYESDSGMKSDSGQRVRIRTKTKNSRRHHRRGITKPPTGLPLPGVFNRSISVENETYQHRCLSVTDYTEDLSVENNEQARSFSIILQDWKQKEKEEKRVETVKERKRPVSCYDFDYTDWSEFTHEKTEHNPSNWGRVEKKSEDETFGWSYWENQSHEEKDTATLASLDEMSPDVDSRTSVFFGGSEFNSSNVQEGVSEERDVVVENEGAETEEEKVEDEPQTEYFETETFTDSKKTSEDSSSSSKNTAVPNPTYNLSEQVLKIQEIPEELHISGTSISLGASSCSCQLVDDRISRAESLLWRIQRFLHESLSLGGSEGDSGFNDSSQSRPISDVDTDPEEGPKFTPATSCIPVTAVTAPPISPLPCSSKPPSPSPVVLRRSRQGPKALREQAASNRVATRPQSLIILESSSSSAEFAEIRKGTDQRSSSAERRKYQRAKTHSRLFQLLQECKPSNSEEDEDEFFDCETVTQVMPKTPLHVETTSTSDTRSRLLLPLNKTITHQSSTSSGSSGVLSPTSPQGRDQLLVDIINEFHLRQTSETERELKNCKINPKVPSKIFKLLQEEFGQEFYQTFECGGIEPLSPGEVLLQSTSLLSTTTNVGKCYIHQDQKEEVKEDVRDFLEIPQKKLRDFRFRKGTH